MRALAALAALLVAGPLALASSDRSPEATSDVRIANFLYDPSPHYVDLGDVVRFTNEDTAPHTATCDSPGCSFDTPTLAQGESASVTIPLAGTLTYFCIVHPDMTGKLYAGSLDAAHADLDVAAIAARREPLAGTLVPDPTTVIVSAAIANAGALPTGATDARFTFVNALGQTKAIGDATVPALAPGATATIEVAWLGAPPAGETVVTARIDLFNAIPESREANNVLAASLATGLQ